MKRNTHIAKVIISLIGVVDLFRWCEVVDYKLLSNKTFCSCTPSSNATVWLTAWNQLGLVLSRVNVLPSSKAPSTYLLKEIEISFEPYVKIFFLILYAFFRYAHACCLHVLAVVERRPLWNKIQLLLRFIAPKTTVWRHYQGCIDRSI